MFSKKADVCHCDASNAVKRQNVMHPSICDRLNCTYASHISHAFFIMCICAFVWHLSNLSALCFIFAFISRLALQGKASGSSRRGYGRVLPRTRRRAESEMPQLDRKGWAGEVLRYFSMGTHSRGRAYGTHRVWGGRGCVRVWTATVQSRVWLSIVHFRRVSML